MKIIVSSISTVPQAIPVIAKWLNAEWGYLHKNDSIERREAQLNKRMNADSIPFTLVAHDGAVPLGTGSVVQYDIPGRDDLTPCVASVYVPVDYRRMGVGSAIMKALVKQAGLLGYEKLFLFTWDQEKLYSSLGWKKVGKSTFHGSEIVIMEWAMTPPSIPPDRRE